MKLQKKIKKSYTYTLTVDSNIKLETWMSVKKKDR
jgi:hypothetical protein